VLENETVRFCRNRTVHVSVHVSKREAYAWCKTAPRQDGSRRSNKWNILFDLSL